MERLKRILVVEDETAVADALVRRLTARGYGPRHVREPAEAVGVFDELRPDLVIVSLTLPDDGGRQVCRGIRSRPLGALVPVLLVGTGREDVRSVGEAIAAGADHWFIKPDGIEELIGKIGTYIGPGLVEEPAAARPDSEPPSRGEVFATLQQVLARRGTPPPPDAGLDWAALDEMLQEEPTPSPFADVAVAEEPSPPAAEAPSAARPPARPDAFGWTLDDEERFDAPRGATGAPPPPAPSDLPGRDWRDPEPPPADVEAAWSSVLQPGRALPLERRGMGEILAAAAQVRLTGRIEVAAAGVLRRVFVEGGAPVYADSSAASEDLAAHLAAEGRVARGALAQARDRARVSGASPEEVLIEAGLLQADDVYRALRSHVVERVLALFALEAGEAVVIQGGPRPLDPVDLGMHTGRLVLDGIRRKYGRLRLYRVFGTASAVARPRPGAQAPAGLVLRPDEEALWKSCDGRRTVIEVARAAQMGEVDALAVLYALSVLELVEAPAGRRTGVLPALEAEVLTRAGVPRTADQMPGFADLVSAKLTEVITADYFQVLGVHRGVTTAELRAAWEALRRRFDPHRVRRDGPLWHQVAEIAAVVDDAYAMLSDDRLRRLYERALS